MVFAAVIRASIFTFALVATLTEGYEFVETSDLSTDSAATEESTGLTTNEEARIHGGSEADASQFPFIVSLRKDEAGGNTYCGGTLIAPQYVVTAGHCIKTNETTIYASIGSAFGSGSSGQQIKVIKGYRHPMYNKAAHLYDVGILKLEKAVTTETIDLCAADGSDNKVGRVATVGGWGLTENGTLSRVLEKVDVPIISNAECNKQYNNRITEGMLCAGEGNGKDTCSGDSGGPLIANDVLVGIVSWGGKCGVNSGVYTRVSYVQDYINDILSGGNGNTFASGPVNQRSADESTSAPTPQTPASNTPATAAPTTTTVLTTKPEAPATDAPIRQTESPIADIPLTDPIENSTESTEQIELSSNQAEQSVPTTGVPSTSSPVPSGKKAQYSKTNCASQL